MTDTERQYYTIETANRALPLVRSIVTDIVELYRDVHERRERLNRVRQLPGSSTKDDGTVYSEELEQMEYEIDQDIERLKGFSEELQKLGVELKDPIVGLIDFYAQMDGRDVYLCWKLGEEEVAWWHELEAGFAGRQSLMEDSIPGDSVSASELN